MPLSWNEIKNRSSIWKDLLSLFYPHICAACGRNTPPHGHVVCVSCLYKLPKTNFHLHKENPFTERFWGRLSLQAGAAQFFFTKGSRTQQLIHQLKYKNKQEIGVQMGKLYGAQLRESQLFRQVDAIVPVPLHPKKEWSRGYNQSALFAQGLSETLGKPLLNRALQRSTYAESQTQKSREERLDNIARAFVIGDAGALRGKHILLVDDVLTTGATLEACGLRLLDVPGVQLSMATMAITMD
ncbi:MAG: ComF family protein [Saprospiraceae bacterium]|nr:ComF family protein [Saprospiraceae bacterium]